MQHARLNSSTWLGLVALGLCGACQDGAQAPLTQGSPAALEAHDWSVLLPWGAGAGEVGLRGTQPDFPGTGVASVAVGPTDGVLLLDRVNQRVVSAGPKGSRVLAEVPRDAEDLAVGVDGAFAVHSLLRARVWLYDGAVKAGELAIDRSLRELVGVSVGRSRRVFVHNAFQETWLIGSPAAPQSLTQTLHGKRKGAFLLADGAGVQVLLAREPSGTLPAKGHPELLVVRTGERTRVVARHVLPETVLSARVVGLAGHVACLRLEEGEHGTTVRVTRRVVCHDVQTGARVFEKSLGARGLYLPRRDLAVGQSPARLVFIRPEEKGLRVHHWVLPVLPVLPALPALPTGAEVRR